MARNYTISKTQFAELLEASGVDTVKELRTRNADNLTTEMEEVITFVRE